MNKRSFTAQLLIVLSGLIVWAVHFLAIYIFNALACARDFAAADLFGVGIVPLTILGGTVAALALLAAVQFAAAGGRGDADHRNVASNQRFLRGLTIGIGLLSAVAIILETVPVLMIPPCG